MNFVTHPGSQASRTQTVLLLRWVLIIATSYLVLFSRGNGAVPPRVALFVAAYFGSNLLLTTLQKRVRSQRWLDTGIALFDTLAVSLGLYLSDNVTSDFFLVYFLVVFLGALTERLALVVGAAVLCSLVHLMTVSRFVDFSSLISQGYILRIPFLFVVALFFGHMVEEEAKARDRMKTEFLSTASHDLKNPVGLIQTMVEMLLEGEAGPLNAKQTDLVRRIHANARRVVTLSLNLLDASRIESGNLMLQRSAEHLADVVEDALPLARSAGYVKGVGLRCDFDQTVPKVSVDFVQMQRVIFNLLDNAIKYTPERGTVSVAIRRVDDHVALTVCDDGPGIAAEELPRLFEKYRSRSGRRTEGSGLGLFIVKAIVEAHGGTVEAESTPGRGTTMTVLLPLAPGEPRRPWRSNQPAPRAQWQMLSSDVPCERSSASPAAPPSALATSSRS